MDNAPLRVHPAAEAYRTMTEKEVAALAADIAANRQHDDVVIGRVRGTKEWFLVDGRNRARACGIAGVKPSFETREFSDEDAIRAFVRSRSERRYISRAQRAMGHALLYPEPEKGGRGKKNVLATQGFSSARLSQARTVLAFSRDLALAVRDGTESLDAAYAKVKAARGGTGQARRKNGATDTKQARAEFMATCPVPRDEVEVMAQIILSVIKHPDGIETIDFEIARELVESGYRRK